MKKTVFSFPFRSSTLKQNNLFIFIHLKYYWNEALYFVNKRQGSSLFNWTIYRLVEHFRLKM